MLSVALLLALNPGPVFLDRTQALGLTIGGDGACWADFDGDGWPDLCAGGAAWRNEKGVRFTKIADTGPVVAADYDNDGRTDLFSWSPPRLWRNTGESFEQAPLPELPKTVSRGACWGDFDSDGELDLFAGNFAHVDSRGDQPKSRFLRNLGPTGGFKFEDKGTCGVFYQESYASPAAGDYDNDGDLDLLFTTVYADASFGRKNYPVLYRNDGVFAFADGTAAAGLSLLGATYQAAWADFDRDGDLDLVTAGKLFVNMGTANRSLAVRLIGDGKTVNRSAIGAQVRVRIGAATRTRQVEAGTGEGNQNDLTLHFGLGEHKGAVDLEVLWPHGKKQTVRGVRAGATVEVRYR